MSLVLSRVEGLKKVGGRYMALCPAHDDQAPSLSIDEGDDGRVLLVCRAGCSFDAVVAGSAFEVTDLFPATSTTTNGHKASREIVAEYSYVDENGRELFQAVRFIPKDFRQRQRAPENPKADRDGWVWNIQGVRRVLFNLPEVIAAVAAGVTVYVVEGEKDVNAIEAAGEVATCCPMGAGKWKSEYGYAEFFKGADVVIVADQDPPGITHAHDVEASLVAVAASVRVVAPATGKDASDHLAAGHGLDNFVEATATATTAAPALRVTSEQFFTDRGALITARLGKHIRSTGNLRTGADGRLYRYQSGVYRPDGEVWARAASRKPLSGAVVQPGSGHLAGGSPVLIETGKPRPRGRSVAVGQLLH